MKVKNSIEVEPPSIRGIPRILVSYYRAMMETEEYNLVSRLIADLQSIGIIVIADEIQDITIPLKAQLHDYDWILLVQTKDASSFAFVKERLARALNQEGRQHQGVLYVYVSASHAQKTLPSLDSTTFDAGIDYARAFAGIVLMIHPAYRTRLYGVERGAATSNIAPSHPFSDIFEGFSFPLKRIVAQRKPFSLLFIVLAVLILLGVIITHSFAFSSVKTTAVKTTVIKIPTSNHPTNTPTVIAKTTTPQSLYTQATSRTPVINDPLQSQSVNQWDIIQQQGMSCAFANGSYHVSILPPSQGARRYICLAQKPVFTNFAMQVDMHLLQGDVGGMIFRADGRNSYSWFALDTHGCYRLVHITADGQTHILSKDQQSCLAITMQNTNRLTVIAQGSNIYLYINGKFMNRISDPSSIKGGIGLIAIKRTHPTEVAFTNLKVWQ